MSSDNYFTIKRDPADGLWYLYGGAMSNLEDGRLATTRGSDGFATESEALAFYAAQRSGFGEDYYSEYGLIDEDEEDSGLPTPDGYPKATRIEVIDATGRVFVGYFDTAGASMSVQDDGQTIKLFARGTKR